MDGKGEHGCGFCLQSKRCLTCVTENPQACEAQILSCPFIEEELEKFFLMVISIYYVMTMKIYGFSKTSSNDSRARELARQLRMLIAPLGDPS